MINGTRVDDYSELDREAIGDYKMKLWQKLVFKLTGRLYIGHQTHESWKGSLPHYIIKCPVHGQVVTYPHGYEGRLECPRCLEDSVKAAG